MNADSRIKARSRVSAHDVFRRYKKETKQEVRKPDVKENKALKEIKEVWQRFKYSYDDRDEVDTEVFGNYVEASALVKVFARLPYTPKDVQLFAIALAEFQEEPHFNLKAGVFLSALINNGSAKHYNLDLSHLSHLSEGICFLGYENNKIVNVTGNVDVGLGQEMRAGRIVLDGNAGVFAGSDMSGGTLVIKGDVLDNLGDGMSGGKIILHGSAYPDVGKDMSGGEIHLNGDPARIGCNIHGGKIYYQGKLIAGKE